MALATRDNPAVLDLWNANEAAAVAAQKLAIRRFGGEEGLDAAYDEAQRHARRTSSALDDATAAVDVDASLAAGIDTGHYDDAHSFGWAKPSSSGSPGGWKRPVRIVVPVVVAALLGIGAVIVLSGGDGGDDSGSVADALQTSTTFAATEALPVVDSLTISFARPVSTYAVTAHDPGGGELAYRWTMTGESCGTPKTPWTQTGASVTWSHGDAAPDSCKHLGTDHAVDVGLLISTSGGPNDGAHMYCALHGTEKQTVAPARACGRA